MQVTGYQIREAIRQWELRRTAATKMFEGSLAYFENMEPKPDPVAVANSIQQADESIAKLQGIQTKYNLAISIRELDGLDLGTAVRMIGGAGRLEKLWRSTVGDDDSSRRRARLYGIGGITSRKTDDIVATEVLSQQERLELASHAARRAGRLRSLVAAANATAVEIEADPTLFEV